jgi:hypothetical protein
MESQSVVYSFDNSIFVFQSMTNFVASTDTGTGREIYFNRTLYTVPKRYRGTKKHC